MSFTMFGNPNKQWRLHPRKRTKRRRGSRLRGSDIQRERGKSSLGRLIGVVRSAPSWFGRLVRRKGDS